MEEPVVIHLGLLKISGEVIDKLKARDFNVTSLSTYDFSTLYTTLPHNLIQDQLIDHIERNFQRECTPNLACNSRSTHVFHFGKAYNISWIVLLVINVRIVILKLSISLLYVKVLCSTFYGVYISYLIRFARAYNSVADFKTAYKLLTQKLLKQGYRYLKLRQTFFPNFYCLYYDLMSKFYIIL